MALLWKNSVLSHGKTDFYCSSTIQALQLGGQVVCEI